MQLDNAHPARQLSTRDNENNQQPLQSRAVPPKCTPVMLRSHRRRTIHGLPFARDLSRPQLRSRRQHAPNPPKNGTPSQTNSRRSLSTRSREFTSSGLRTLCETGTRQIETGSLPRDDRTAGLSPREQLASAVRVRLHRQERCHPTRALAFEFAQIQACATGALHDGFSVCARPPMRSQCHASDHADSTSLASAFVLDGPLGWLEFWRRSTAPPAPAPAIHCHGCGSRVDCVPQAPLTAMRTYVRP